MPFPWMAAATLAGAGLGFFGSKKQNEENRREAERNRQFQERMSSTAAQRSRADYEAAGLNPALAYGNTASTPGGAVAQIGDSLERAGTTAKAFSETAQAMKIARQDAKWRQEQAMAEIAMKQKQGNLLETQDRLANQQIAFLALEQPHTLRRIAAESLFAQYQLPGAKNEAKLNEKLGILKPGIGLLTNTGKSITQMLSPWK